MFVTGVYVYATGRKKWKYAVGFRPPGPRPPGRSGAALLRTAENVQLLGQAVRAAGVPFNILPSAQKAMAEE